MELPQATIINEVSTMGDSIHSVIENDVHAITRANARSSEFLREAEDIVSKPYARQILDKAVGDAILNSQSPPESSGIKSCNISMPINGLAKISPGIAKDFLLFFREFNPKNLIHLNNPEIESCDCSCD